MNDSAIVGLFQKHLVPIYITFEKAGHPGHSCLITAFVLEVRGCWYLMTAGHCIEDIEKNLSQGFVPKCFLFDGLQPDAPHDQPIPFAYKKEATFWVHEDGGDDYGFFAIHSHYRRLLKANGVKALTEEVWKLQPDRPEFYILLGYPMQLLAKDADVVYPTCVLMKVDPLARRPKGLKKAAAKRFYGRVTLKDLTELEGCSGGPVLSFQRTPDGGLRYWLHAVQSGYVKQRRGFGAIAACPMRPLAQLIEETHLATADQGEQ